jgi:enamine deaminase RidA (YjgF/YER057c/UK114 family)
MRNCQLRGGNTRSSKMLSGFKVMTAPTISFEQSTVKLHVKEAGKCQAFIVASVEGEEDAASAARASYAMIADALFDRRMQIVHERVFGSMSVETAVLRERKAALSEHQIPADGPVTYVEGTPPWGEGLAGIIIHAVSQDSTDDVWTIMDGDNPCGRGWKRNGSTCLMLQNINGRPDGSSENERRSFQPRQMLDRAERILRENKASYKDVVRTWFYLSDILDWYAAFNKVRNEKYGELGIMPGPGDTRLLLPASTGIGADMSSGAVSTMDLLALVDEDNSESMVKKLTNRGQLDAFRYGAAFSRGAVIKEEDAALIQVSGTAAIDEHGVSLYPGDIRSQINCTFDKIKTLLSLEGAALSDICAATVFVKRPEYAEVFWEMVAERGLEDFPAVCVVADVCREELLFEIDAEASVRKEMT